MFVIEDTSRLILSGCPANSTIVTCSDADHRDVIT